MIAPSCSLPSSSSPSAHTSSMSPQSTAPPAPHARSAFGTASPSGTPIPPPHQTHDPRFGSAYDRSPARSPRRCWVSHSSLDDTAPPPTESSAPAPSDTQSQTARACHRSSHTEPHQSRWSSPQYQASREPAGSSNPEDQPAHATQPQLLDQTSGFSKQAHRHERQPASRHPFYAGPLQARAQKNDGLITKPSPLENSIQSQ